MCRRLGGFEGLEFRVGLRVDDLGFRVQGLGLRVQGLGLKLFCHSRDFCSWRQLMGTYGCAYIKFRHEELALEVGSRHRLNNLIFAMCGGRDLRSGSMAQGLRMALINGTHISCSIL